MVENTANRRPVSFYRGGPAILLYVLLFLTTLAIHPPGYLMASAQVADPVDPHYDHSTIAKFYTFPFPVPDNASLKEICNRQIIGYAEMACLNKANIWHSTHNQMFVYGK